MTRETSHYFNAPIIGALPAGGVFITCTVLINAYAALPDAIEVDSTALLVVPLGLITCSIFGWLIAIIPTIIGTTIMAAIGCEHKATRNPLCWAFAGAAPIAMFSGIAGGFDRSDAPFTVALIITGAVCALTCRRFTRWGAVLAPTIHETAKITV